MTAASDDIDDCDRETFTAYVDVYPKDAFETIATTYAFDSDVEQKSTTNRERLFMTTTPTKTYLVGVIEQAIAYYMVDAENARTAAENWEDGEFLDRDDEALDSEGPCNVREKQPNGGWMMLPPSEWEAAPGIARFDDFEIEPRVKHWEEGDPLKPDHIHCDKHEEHEADMWRLYGTVRGRDSVCIGEYNTRALAEEVYAGITGRGYAGQTSRDPAKKPYSVLLLYPDYANDSGTETYYALVEASDPIEAVAQAQREAFVAQAQREAFAAQEEGLDYEPDDFAPLLVTGGHHHSQALFNR